MKKLRSIVVGMFLILAAAVPVFAVDGVENTIQGFSLGGWGWPVMRGHTAVLDTKTGLVVYDTDQNTWKQIYNGTEFNKFQKSLLSQRLV